MYKKFRNLILFVLCTGLITEIFFFKRHSVKILTISHSPKYQPLCIESIFHWFQKMRNISANHFLPVLIAFNTPFSPNYCLHCLHNLITLFTLSRNKVHFNQIFFNLLKFWNSRCFLTKIKINIFENNYLQSFLDNDNTGSKNNIKNLSFTR